MPLLIAIGNSHLDALFDAAQSDTARRGRLRVNKVSLLDPALQPTWRMVDKQIAYGEAFTAAVASFGRPDAPRLCFWGSNAHFSSAILSGAIQAGGRPFDFVLPEMPECPPDPTLELAPYDVVREHLAVSIHAHVGLLRMVRTSTKGTLWSVPPPPPVRGDMLYRRLGARIAAMQGPDPDAQPERLLPPREIAPPRVRLKLWRLALMIMRNVTATEGATFLEPPDETMDADGFLLPRFEADSLHANPHYGEALMHRILTLMAPGDEAGETRSADA